MSIIEQVDVVIVGSGFVGLVVVIELCCQGVVWVCVLECDGEVGGIFWYCVYLLFGLCEYGCLLIGLVYVQCNVEQVEWVGVDICLCYSVVVFVVVGLL